MINIVISFTKIKLVVPCPAVCSPTLHDLVSLRSLTFHIFIGWLRAGLGMLPAARGWPWGAVRQLDTKSRWPSGE